MANKKVSQLVSKPSVLVTDLFPIADPTTGQLYKTTISDLGTAIGSGVSSVNTLVGAVVLDTDDIQELASPTNRWFTDTRARAAVSASSPLAYNSGTGVFSIPAATSSQDGYLTSADWTTFNAKQAALSGTGFVKISGTTISYDNSTYLTTSAAASTYLALSGGTLTGALNGTSATFTGDVTLSSTNPRLYFTDTDNNPDYFISNTDGTFTVYDVTNSTSRLTIGTTGNGTFGGNLTVGQIIRSGGTSAQFLKADGSVDSSVYALDSAVVKLTGAQTIAGVKTMSNVFKLDDTLQIKNIAQLSNSTGYTGIWAETAAIGFYTGANAIRLLYAGNYNYTMPASDGTLALSSQLSAYLPLAGGTLTGALNGTSALFSGAVRANNPSEGATGEGLIAGQSFKIDGTGTSQKAVMYMVSNVLSDTYASGLTAQYANFAGDKAFGFNLNTSGGFELYVKNTTFNKAITVANSGAATFSSSVSATTASFTHTSGDTITLSKGSGPSIQFAKTDATAQAWALAGEGTAFKLYNYTGGTTPLVVTTAGNVGIGTTAPQGSYMLTICGDSSSRTGGITFRQTSTDTFYMGNPAVTNTTDFELWNPRDGYTRFATNNTERMRITSGGDLQINNNSSNGVVGTNFQAFAFSSNSFFRLGNNTSNSLNIQLTRSDSATMFSVDGHSGAGYLGASAWTYGSDLRLKENVNYIEEGLSKILALKPAKFDYIKGLKNNIGWIAQDVKLVIPEAVDTISEDNDQLTLKSDFIVPYLVKAVQQLEAKIKTLENK